MQCKCELLLFLCLERMTLSLHATVEANSRPRMHIFFIVYGGNLQAKFFFLFLFFSLSTTPSLQRYRVTVHIEWYHWKRIKLFKWEARGRRARTFASQMCTDITASWRGGLGGEIYTHTHTHEIFTLFHFSNQPANFALSYICYVYFSRENQCCLNKHSQLAETSEQSS